MSLAAFAALALSAQQNFPFIVHIESSSQASTDLEPVSLSNPFPCYFLGVSECSSEAMGLYSEMA